MYQTFIKGPCRHGMGCGCGMGAAFVPFTFPTASVFNRMEFYGTKPASYATVDAMFQYYAAGIQQNGIKPINFKASAKDNEAIWNWMGKKYDAKTIQNFFRALHDIPEQWWREGKTSPGQVIGSAVTSVAKKTVGGTKAAIKTTVTTATDIATAAPKAFFGQFSKPALIIGGVLTVAVLGGGLYIAVKAAKP